MTSRGRRARRLELDAARHEEAVAYRALLAARAGTRAAHAEVLSAKARSAFPGAPAVWEARRQVQEAKRAEKSAALELRASRVRVRATAQQLSAAGTSAPPPLARVFAAHDAVNSRFLDYQTDPEKVIAYPVLSDPRHPATLAFLQAQREAQWLRPASAQVKIAPPDYIAYREAVRKLEAAFEAAERAARTQPGPTLSSARATTPLPPRHPDPTLPPARSETDRSRRASTEPTWPVPRREGLRERPAPSES
jgi:hypothetical protein